MQEKVSAAWDCDLCDAEVNLQWLWVKLWLTGTPGLASIAEQVYSLTRRGST